MNTHLFIPSVDFSTLQLLPEHERWLIQWLQILEGYIESKSIAASECLQGVISELALYKRVRTDWMGIMDAFLLDGETPLAYSETYGKRLYKFDGQWHQTPIHAIHARWWIENTCSNSLPSSLDYGALIENFVQPSGWIYNPRVSITKLQTRMRSEYMMSFAMGLEILKAYNLLEQSRHTLEATIAIEPLTVFLSAEYFRQKSLEILDALSLAPADFHSILTICKLDEGFSDFSVNEKRDDYMGTLKRVTRDVAIHSPLSALHARYIASLCDPSVENDVIKGLTSTAAYLRSNPLSINPFKIRDIPVPFGTDISPLELISASSIAYSYG